jgi:Domain of unknown function (DUF1906)
MLLPGKVAPAAPVVLGFDTREVVTAANAAAFFSQGVASGTASQQVIDYCNSWYSAVAAASYLPGLYVGANAILSGQALYQDLRFSHYWKSLSTVPDVAVRSYQMIQSNEQTLNGIDIDENQTQYDLRGGTVVWLSPTTGGRGR